MDDLKELIWEVGLLKEQVVNMKQAVQVFDVYMRQHLPDFLKVLKKIEENTRKEEKEE